MVKNYLPTSVGGEIKVFPAKKDNDQAPNVDNGDLQSLSLQQREDGFSPNDIIPSKTHNFFFYLTSKLVSLIQKHSLLNLFTPVESGANAGKNALAVPKGGIVVVPKTDETQYFVALQKVDKESIASPDLDYASNESTRRRFKLLDLSKVVVQEDDIPAGYVGESIFVKGVGEMQWIPQTTIPAGRSLAWLKIIGDNGARNGTPTRVQDETTYDGDIEELVIPAHYRSLRVGELVHAPKQPSGGPLKSFISTGGTTQEFYNKAWAGLSLDNDSTALKYLPINKDTVGLVSYLLEARLAGMMACLSNNWNPISAQRMLTVPKPPAALKFSELYGFISPTVAFELFANYVTGTGGVLTPVPAYPPTDNLFFHFKIFRGRNPTSNVLDLNAGHSLIFPPSFPYFIGGVGTDHFQPFERSGSFSFLPTEPADTLNGGFFSKKRQTGQFVPNATSIPTTSSSEGNYPGGLQGESTRRQNFKGLAGFVGQTYMDLSSADNDRRPRLTLTNGDDTLQVAGYTYSYMAKRVRDGGYAFEHDILNLYSGDPTTNPQYIAMPLWIHL